MTNWREVIHAHQEDPEPPAPLDGWVIGALCFALLFTVTVIVLLVGVTVSIVGLLG